MRCARCVVLIQIPKTNASQTIIDSLPLTIRMCTQFFFLLFFLVFQCYWISVMFACWVVNEHQFVQSITIMRTFLKNIDHKFLSVYYIPSRNQPFTHLKFREKQKQQNTQNTYFLSWFFVQIGGNKNRETQFNAYTFWWVRFRSKWTLAVLMWNDPNVRNGDEREWENRQFCCVRYMMWWLNKFAVDISIFG